MRRLLVRRLLLLLPTMLGAATIVFALLRAVPGDPVEIMLGESASPADAAALRRDLGLDGPPAAQYVGFLARLLRGDLGRSITYREPVASVILSRYGATLQLAAAAALVAVGLALPLGLLAAARPRSSLDRLARLVSLLGVCVPSFWLGPLLILVFSIQLGWLPVSGRGGPDTVVLPALTLGLGMAGILTRLTRTTMLAALREDWVRTARARGAPEWRVFAIHALRYALPPVVTVAGLQAGGLLAGAIITETIFAWPGMGRLFYDGLLRQDYTRLMGIIFIASFLIAILNLIADTIYGVLDPRIRLAR